MRPYRLYRTWSAIAARSTFALQRSNDNNKDNANNYGDNVVYKTGMCIINNIDDELINSGHNIADRCEVGV